MHNATAKAFFAYLEVRLPSKHLGSIDSTMKNKVAHEVDQDIL